MISCDSLESQESGGINNCTTVSTFEKPNSLKFELLFGEYERKLPRADNGAVNAFDYVFSPNQIFGFVCESTGNDFKKFHHAFVLRSCNSGEKGVVIPGVSPGAEILIKTLTAVGSVRLKSILQKLERNKVNLAAVPMSYYRHLNNLLEIKANADFFVGELIAEQIGFLHYPKSIR